MVYVRLAEEWTDSAGISHAAGEMVDVDAATLATLEASGVVTEPEPSPDGGWAGPSGGGGTDGGWAGPSSTDPDDAS